MTTTTTTRRPEGQSRPTVGAYRFQTTGEMMKNDDTLRLVVLALAILVKRAGTITCDDLYAKVSHVLPLNVVQAALAIMLRSRVITISEPEENFLLTWVGQPEILSPAQSE